MTCGCECKKVIEVQIEGIQGPTGEAGVTPDFDAEAETLDAGSDATAEALQSEDKTSVTLKLGIPRGRDGAGADIAENSDIDNLFGV